MTLGLTWTKKLNIFKYLQQTENTHQPRMNAMLQFNSKWKSIYLSSLVRTKLDLAFSEDSSSGSLDSSLVEHCCVVYAILQHFSYKPNKNNGTGKSR